MTMTMGSLFDGTVYTAEGFDRTKLCRVVNSLLAYKNEIENREYYILGVIANIAGGTR